MGHYTNRISIILFDYNIIPFVRIFAPYAIFGEYLSRRLTKVADRHDVSIDHIDAGQPHVIIAGFGRVGRRVARILQASRVPYLAVDTDADRVLEGRRDGFSVFYGDDSQVEVLKAAGAEQAEVLVCTLD